MRYLKNGTPRFHAHTHTHTRTHAYTHPLLYDYVKNNIEECPRKKCQLPLYRFPYPNNAPPTPSHPLPPPQHLHLHCTPPPPHPPPLHRPFHLHPHRHVATPPVVYPGIHLSPSSLPPPPMPTLRYPIAQTLPRVPARAIAGVPAREQP